MNDPSSSHAAPMADAPTEPRDAPPRHRVLLTVIFITLIVVGVVAVLAIRGIGGPAPATDAVQPVLTVPVTTGDMVSATNAKATLHHAAESAFVATSSGVLTALPTAGTVIAPGGTLYRVDDKPVVLLRGSLPAWRTFEAGMTPGEDVRQLEQALADAGAFRGKADTTFTSATADAIRAWQKTLRVERTGKLERTDIVFSGHDLRVTELAAALGAEVGAGTTLYRVSATEKVVDLDLRLAEQQLAVVGTEVRITLPDGSATTGSIAAVGDPVERDSEDDSSTGTTGTFVVPVTVTLTDQAAVAAFPRASVTVQFSSTLADDVLTVPVEALVAVDATSFAVETPSDQPSEAVRRIPVAVGAFASGRVQITGDGIRDGLPVAVPAS
jgi:peptidoglycan hydrolase-like protein with peptidoglycan-binding domain